MNQTLSDKLMDIGFWIAVPTMRLTEKHPDKAVRVLGALGAFVLFPLLVLGMAVIFAAVAVGLYEEI